MVTYIYLLVFFIFSQSSFINASENILKKLKKLHLNKEKISFLTACKKGNFDTVKNIYPIVKNSCFNNNVIIARCDGKMIITLFLEKEYYFIQDFICKYRENPTINEITADILGLALAEKNKHDDIYNYLYIDLYPNLKIVLSTIINKENKNSEPFFECMIYNALT